MADLVYVEDAPRYLIPLLQVYSILLHVNVVPDNWCRFEHLQPVHVRCVTIYHPRGRELRRLPNVDLLVFLEGVFPVQGLGIHGQPPVCLANAGHRWRLHRAPLCIEMNGLSLLGLRLSLHSQVVRGRVLVELISIDMKRGVRDSPSYEGPFIDVFRGNCVDLRLIEDLIA